ncbi:MAG TPA: glycine cleavage system protein GcvH [Acidimicrobiia bacterium]|jgi:glycine cleavage system H protein
MQIPEELSYSSDHEWVRVEGGTATIGITDFAQDALGDVVYVSPPEIGTTIAVGDTVSEIESTKSVSEIYTPLAGEITARNERLDGEPELVNSDPYGDGWILQVQLTDGGAPAGLLDAAAYRALTEAG